MAILVKKEERKSLIRKTTDLGQKSNLYKKGYESWNICDYRFYEDCKAEFNVEDMNFWKKWYFRK